MEEPDSLATRYEAVYRFLRRRSPNREEAEDLTQEVFAAGAKALAEARLDEAGPTLAWLYTVARRRLIDRLRDHARQPQFEGEVDLSGDERMYGSLLTGLLLEALRGLGKEQREVVVLKLFEGRPFSEISTLVGASEEACRARFSRALATLRTALTEKGVTP